jgi:hypothetical protein
LTSERAFPDDATVGYGNPLCPEESLDEDVLGEDIADGYSPAERPRGVSAWGSRSTRSPGTSGWDVAWLVNDPNSP